MSEALDVGLCNPAEQLDDDPLQQLLDTLGGLLLLNFDDDLILQQEGITTISLIGVGKSGLDGRRKLGEERLEFGVKAEERI